MAIRPRMISQLNEVRLVLLLLLLLLLLLMMMMMEMISTMMIW